MPLDTVIHGAETVDASGRRAESIGILDRADDPRNPRRDDRLWLQSVKRCAQERYGAGIGPQKPGDDIEDRGFAAVGIAVIGIAVARSVSPRSSIGLVDAARLRFSQQCPQDSILDLDLRIFQRDDRRSKPPV